MPKWSPIFVLTRLIVAAIWSFTLTALIVGSCLCCALIKVFRLVILLSLCENKLKFTAHPSLYWLTFAQYKHEQKVKAVRVNGQTTGRNIRQIKQIFQILLISWNFGKTQLSGACKTSLSA